MAREVTKHGMSGYRAGHRCEECRRGKRDYMREYRAKKRLAAAAVAMTDAEPLLDDSPLRPPVAAAGSLDMAAGPGPLEQMLLADLAAPDEKVAFRRHLVGLARLNARVLDQIGGLDRLDLISPLQLRQLEVLQRLAILGFKGLEDDDTAGDVAAAAARMLQEIDAEAAGGAGG